MTLKIYKYYKILWHSRILIIKLLLCLTLMISPLIFHSCGIYSFKGISISPEIKTVSIKTFSNQASLVVPSLSETLTEKLKDKFIEELSLTLVEYDGDIDFKGSITNYSTAPASIQSNDQAATTRLTLSINIKFKNTFESEKNFQTTFSNYLDFDSGQNLSEIEDELIDELSDMLVQDIFNKSVNNW